MAESLRARPELQIGPWTAAKLVCPLQPHPSRESHPLPLHFQPKILSRQGHCSSLAGQEGAWGCLG